MMIKKPLLCTINALKKQAKIDEFLTMLRAGIRGMFIDRFKAIKELIEPYNNNNMGIVNQQYFYQPSAKINTEGL